MKVLLGSLMCLILTMTQVFAISGGPWGTTQVTVTGTYAGVLRPILASNNLGLFTLKIPQIGLATGDFLIFTGERTFVGTITGVADPNSAKLDATLQGIPVVTGGGQTVTTLNFHADGSL